MPRQTLPFLLVVTALACDKPASPPRPLAPEPGVDARADRPIPDLGAASEPTVELVVEEALLWSVRSPAGAQSHLLGTFHFGTDFRGLAELPEDARAAFAASRKVVLEADPGAPLDASAREHLFMDGEKFLSTSLRPDQWETLLEESGLPPRQLERAAPHVAVSALTRRWVDPDAVRGMDGRFLILAKAHEKKLVFLESNIEQLALLDEVIDLDMLAEMLDDVPGEKARLRKALVDFRAADVEALTAWVFEPAQMKRHPGLHERTYAARNRTWIEALAPLLDEGGAFVAVGVGHLLGEDSLPQLLADRGYVVERVSDGK